jgi:hypothetical protein
VAVELLLDMQLELQAAVALQEIQVTNVEVRLTTVHRVRQELSLQVVRPPQMQPSVLLPPALVIKVVAVAE